MWETTFPINSHAGLGMDFTNMFHTREYVSFVKWQDDDSISKCHSNSQDDDSMMIASRCVCRMCLSNSQDDDSMMTTS